MRLSNVLALVLVSLVALSVCGQTTANAATPAAGVPSPAYDTSADANKRFLADYAVRPNVKKLPDGLMYRVLKPGDGPQPQKNSDVATVYYIGKLISGQVFDRTKPEEPSSIQVGGVIPGWTEALKLMKTGDTWELVIPADLGYGSDGKGEVIPADQTLVFLVNLTKVEYAP
jgi:FKBP-type peptidyl-prolyl cis-trans isomerase FklB